MSKTNEEILSISLLKNSIERILTNIKELEKIKPSNGNPRKHVDRLKQQTEELLQNLETAPLERLSKVLKKNKLKRYRKKCKLNQIKAETRSGIISQDAKSNRIPIIPQNDVHHPSIFCYRDIPSIRKDQHISLQKQHDAQRLLRTFELLKLLHFSRGQNVNRTKEFTEKLHELRTYWVKILEENKVECTQERHVDQWTEKLFGSTEHPHSDSEQKMSEFLRIRHIWDSYLTRSKHGSSIPCGWITPRENVTTEWQQYRHM